MAFRSASCLKSTVNHLKGSSSLNYATAATSKLKAASPLQLKGTVPKSRKGDMVPVCMALGMIGLSTSLGLHTVMQQLRRAPNVHVKKSRRETLPEIVEPEHVAEDAEKFVNKSLFRKAAHIQDFASRRVIPDPRADIYTKYADVLSLQVGDILDVVRSREYYKYVIKLCEYTVAILMQLSYFPMPCHLSLPFSMDRKTFEYSVVKSFIMAFRSSSLWKSMATRVSANSASARSNITKWRSYASTAEHPDAKLRGVKGDFVPVYVALGLIALSAGFGVQTAMHQLKRAPNVSVKKSRRETIPEVTEPEEVVDDADKFIKKSFFRKVAHVQDFDNQSVMPDPIRGDVLAREPHSETLKSVGVNPNP
ncbi:hypothetical protein HAX54_038346 [Datura stramonium]|uniref:Transmembrane protein n=1 Tax=Datura stramonium TaxID=4076 RepID=A0ABS8SHS6_DATST|nr:hypothetical protein [Datura stramonium]